MNIRVSDTGGWAASSVGGDFRHTGGVRLSHPRFMTVVGFPAQSSGTVGYDGLSVTDLLDPPLTTLYLDKRRLGEMAGHQVDRLLTGELPPPPS
ncbi:hypothetical protein [Nonomuraea jabiensis]|uniref:hypothetical protein n=1 Tax=Nonomuraea jabiensis TaxID=882448 RepID=UPI0036819D32